MQKQRVQTHWENFSIIEGPVSCSYNKTVSYHHIYFIFFQTRALMGFCSHQRCITGMLPLIQVLFLFVFLQCTEVQAYKRTSRNLLLTWWTKGVITGQRPPVLVELIPITWSSFWKRFSFQSRLVKVVRMCSEASFQSLKEAELNPTGWWRTVWRGRPFNCCSRNCVIWVGKSVDITQSIF